MGWNDIFKYGMYHGHSVRAVYNSRPSYLVWTVVNTSNRFTEDVMEELHRSVGKHAASVSHNLAAAFRDKFVGGPW